MIRNYFAAALISASTVPCAASHDAFARTPWRQIEPAEQRRTSAWLDGCGKPSYYGPAFNGRQAADGARFNQMLLTAAHPWLPFGTRVRVRLADTSRSVIVTITDRLYSSRRIVDLSMAAARELGMINLGIARVTLALA